MAHSKSFNSVVAARTRAASQILSTPELLAGYQDIGGLPSDLKAICDAGLRAEAANLAQSTSKATSGAATVAVLASFAALQKEYAAIMGVVKAVQHDLERVGAPPDVVEALRHVLVNEAELAVIVETGEDGKKKRTTRRSASQESLRAEIEKDASALLALSGAQAALAARKVESARLTALQAAARELSGKLSDRTAKKGATKTTTADEIKAVTEQRASWGACYRLLAALGAKDARVAALLADAAR